MKILGIVGSLRQGGNTEFAVQMSLKVARDSGADIEMIRLSDYNIQPCNGCGKCKHDICPINDGMEKLLLKLANADAIIFGSPVYYGGISGGLKCFLDRCRPLKLQGNKLKGKLGGAIAVGKVWGHANVIDTILHFFGSQGMYSVPIGVNPGIGAQIFATGKDDAKNDIDGQKAVQELGKKIVERLT